MKEWIEDDEQDIRRKKIIKVVVALLMFVLVLIIVLLLIKKVNNKRIDENDNNSIEDNSKYSVNTTIGEYNFKNNQEKKAYMDYILELIQPKELQRFCKMNGEYLYTLMDLTEYADGNDVIEHMKYFGYKNFFMYIFENTILENDLPVTDNFVKKFNKELFDYYDFIVDKDKLSLNISVNQFEKTITVNEEKIIKELKDEDGNLLDWDTEVYNVYNLKYILDENGKVDDMILESVDKVLDKDGNKYTEPHDLKFNQSNYSAFIIHLSIGEYYYKKVLGKEYDSEKMLEEYCFTTKLLNSFDLNYSILDKSFVCECADNKIIDICRVDVSNYIKHISEYYDKGFLPISLQNGKIKKHYNVYFTYTDDLYLDDVKVEFLYEENISDE